jgi:hypothetical protein
MIRRRFNREFGTKRFNLELEAFCKKIWKPWFEARRWIFIDLTQQKSALFQVEEKPWAPEVKRDVRDFLKNLNFPHDFELHHQGMGIILQGDFKFKVDTSLGIWILKRDYDRYYKSKNPCFLLAIWASDKKKRYIHIVQNPRKYDVCNDRAGNEYYDITDDCVPYPDYDIPLKTPIPRQTEKYLAFWNKMSELAMSGIFPSEAPPYGKKDIKKARAHEGLITIYPVRHDDIEKMEGWEARVLKPIQPHKRMDKVSILGFDTEFHEDRLLSVQLALMDNEGKLKSKCIMEKLEGYDAKRLLKDALDFMFECGVQPFNRIYLIAHFAVADLGHLKNCLKDFKFREINRAMHAEFIVPESQHEKELQFKELALGDFRLKIIDLFAYYPKGLDKIGEMIGLPKLEADRANILKFYQENPEGFRAYAVRDAEIALKAFMNLRDFLWNKYKVEIFKSPTIASVASHIFRINYLHEAPSPYTIVAKYQSYRTKKGEWSTRGAKEYRYAGSLDLRDYALRCYWGGRAECFIHGFIKGKFKLYDVVSLYPSASMLQPLPNKDTKWIPITTENMNDEALEGYVCVEFEFPEGTRYPCLPVHGNLENRLYFPLKGISYCTMAEIREALRLGCKIKRIEGYGFKPSDKEFNHDLKAFMKEMLELKAQSPKGSLEHETYKLIANALIGKLAQRRCEDHLDYAQELYAMYGVPLGKFRFKGREKVGSTWAPEWASLILGKARALMSQFINKGALMTVTDSVLLPSNVSLECEALKELRSVGSNLEAEPYEVESALIVRSKLYALMDANGEIVKEAHHAVHLSSEQCKEIFKKALELGYDPDMEGKKEHIAKLKEAIFKGKPLGSSELKPSRIYFRWDYKRILIQEPINMFREYSDTKPIDDVVKFEGEAFAVMKHQRAKLKRGRPREYPLELAEQVNALKTQGKSYRQIAKALSISLGKVQRILKASERIRAT